MGKTEAFEVGEYGDLEGASLSSAGKDRVLEALDTHQAVVWLEDWLRAKKDLEPLEGARGLYGVSLEHQTEDAFCVQQPDGDEVWVPKSSGELYQRSGDGVQERGGEDQHSLMDFAPE